MSESFQAALEKVNYSKYIDSIQDELKRTLADVGPGRTPGQVEATQTLLQNLIRKLSRDLAKEVGLLGNHVMVFMTANAIISTAWVAFTLRRETSDLSRAPEDRLEMIEMLDALELALGRVIESATNYADRYTGRPNPDRATGPTEGQGTPST